MKLDKNTKLNLKPGNILRFNSGESYTITSVFYGTTRNGYPAVNITVCDNYGRHIYCTPSSGFYGAEIIE